MGAMNHARMKSLAATSQRNRTSTKNLNLDCGCGEPIHILSKFKKIYNVRSETRQIASQTNTPKEIMWMTHPPNRTCLQCNHLIALRQAWFDVFVAGSWRFQGGLCDRHNFPSKQTGRHGCSDLRSSHPMQTAVNDRFQPETIMSDSPLKPMLIMSTIIR